MKEKSIFFLSVWSTVLFFPRPCFMFSFVGGLQCCLPSLFWIFEYSKWNVALFQLTVCFLKYIHPVCIIWWVKNHIMEKCQETEFTIISCKTLSSILLTPPFTLPKGINEEQQGIAEMYLRQALKRISFFSW